MQSLNSIRIELTSKCNLSCEFCYRKTNNKTLNLKKIEQFLIMFKNNGGKNIIFTGGESLLYKDIFSVLEFSRKLELENILLTNGTLITEQNILSMKQLVDYIYISIDGPQPYHDFIRGVQGAYEKSIKAINLFNKYNIPYSVQAVITKATVTNIKWIKDIIEKNNIKSFKITPEYYNGLCTLDDKEKINLINQVYNLSEEMKYKVPIELSIFKASVLKYLKLDLNNLLTPWLLSDGSLVAFYNQEKSYFISNIDDYINGKYNRHGILARNKIIDEIINKVYKQVDIIDIMHIQQEEITKFETKR